MKTAASGLVALSAALAMLTASASPASADETTAATQRTTTTKDYVVGPNDKLISHGLFTLGIAYSASAIVALQSNLSSDDTLYIPVAGPWLDLAERGACDECDHEGLNKVMLVVDGIVQGLGVLQIAAGFALTEEREETTTQVATTSSNYGAPANNDGVVTVRAVPFFGKHSYGMRAVAKF